MNSSVTATLMLKFVSVVMSAFISMKWSMSGWSTRRMPMLAPRRVPPCLIASVAESNTVMKETGPLATPIVLRTRSFAGRRREKAKPVPPPDLWMTAVSRIALKMPSIESGTGSTKQAESCCRSRPAFTSVGEFGRKSSEESSR